MTEDKPVSQNSKYKKLYHRLQKQYEDKLLKSHNMLSEYHQTTRDYTSLLNKKNTLLDLLEQMGEKPAITISDASQNAEQISENGVKKEENGNKNKIPEAIVDTDDDTTRLRALQDSGLLTNPLVKEKLRRAINEDFDGDVTLQSLKDWEGILEHSDEQMSGWLKKFLSNWKHGFGKRARSSVEPAAIVKKRKLDDA